MITFWCSSCGTGLQLEDASAGRVRCPHCGQVVSRSPQGSLTGESATISVELPSTPRPLPRGTDGRAELPTHVYADQPSSHPGQPSLVDAPQAAPGGSAASLGQVSSKDLAQLLAPPQGPDELGRLGPYRVLKLLGAGGMGAVFQAEDPDLKRWVAIKAMLPALSANPDSRQRFVREARAAAAVDHEHIIAVHHVGEDRGVPYVVMPLLRGESLHEHLRCRGKLSVPEVLCLGRQIAEGLAAAHERGLLHRDIKPANIWLEQVGPDTAEPRNLCTDVKVKILDFGLARLAQDEGQLTQTGVVLGTPSYMAPEQARGQVLDGRTDLFSLGCVLYRMTTGVLPFQGKDTLSVLMALASESPTPVQELNPAMPQALSDLVLHLLAKDPADRPPSARAVVQQLRAIEARLASPLPPLAPSAARRSEPDTLALAPTPPGPTRRITGKLLGAAGILLFVGLLACFLGPSAYRHLTGQGQLIVQTHDHPVQILIRQNGATVQVITTRSPCTRSLKAGMYELELEPAQPGLRLSSQRILVETGGQETIEIQQDLAASVPGGPSPGPVVEGEHRPERQDVCVVSFGMGKPGALTLVDSHTLHALRSWPLPTNVTRLAVDPDDRKVFVSVASGAQLAVVDMATQEVHSIRSPEIGWNSWDVGYHPQRRMVYLLSASGEPLTSKIVCVDPLREKVMGAIVLGPRRQNSQLLFVVDPTAPRAFVVDRMDRVLLVVDLEARKVSRRVPIPEGRVYSDLAIGPDGQVYAGSRGSPGGGGILRLEGNDYVPRRLGDFPLETERLSVSPDGKRIYAVAGRTMVGFRTADGQQVWSSPGEAILAIAAQSEGEAVYASSLNGTVVELDSRTGEVRHSLPVAEPYALALMPSRMRPRLP